MFKKFVVSYRYFNGVVYIIARECTFAGMWCVGREGQVGSTLLYIVMS